MSNNLDPDQDQNVGPGLDTNCLQCSITAEDKNTTSKERTKEKFPQLYRFR